MLSVSFALPVSPLVIHVIRAVRVSALSMLSVFPHYPCCPCFRAVSVIRAVRDIRVDRIIRVICVNRATCVVLIDCTACVIQINRAACVIQINRVDCFDFAAYAVPFIRTARLTSPATTATDITNAPLFDASTTYRTHAFKAKHACSLLCKRPPTILYGIRATFFRRVSPPRFSIQRSSLLRGDRFRHRGKIDARFIPFVYFTICCLYLTYRKGSRISKRAKKIPDSTESGIFHIFN